MATSIYLDHNATTPLLPEVAAAMAECQRVAFANPASQHAAGRKARQMLEDAREGIAAILGADLQTSQPDTLVFTSGGTEGNNLALLGLTGDGPCRVVISAIEHPSVAEPARELARRGRDVAAVPVLPSGVLDREAFAALLKIPTRLVSIMLGNNETGVVQPIAELAALCCEHGALLHTDAVQAVGKVPVHFRHLGVAAMTIAAHKFHGPCGIGALLLRHGVTLRPQLFGGFQQTRLRPGTEVVALAVGMHEALRCWQREQDARGKRLAELRNHLEALLRESCPNIVVHSADAERLPHTLSVGFPGVNRQALVMALDMAGVACSTGSACASGSSDPSPTLVAMGCQKDVLDGSIRLSLGATTTPADVDEAARRILRVHKELQLMNIHENPRRTPRPKR
jgi:cysteine desulfurase